MKMRFGNLFLAFGALLLVFASALFLFRASVVDYAVTFMLERQGARQVSVAVKRVNASGINFARVDFVLRRGSRVLDVELQNLRVSFAPAKLLHRQVKDIALEQLRLRQSFASGQPPADSASPFDLPKLLHQLSADWQNRLPFNSATIDSLKLSGPDLPPALTQPLTLNVTRTNSAVNVVCRSLSPTASAEFHLLLEKDGETISLNAAVAETGRLTATLSEAHLNGSFSLEAAQLNSLLAHGGRNAVQAFEQIDSATLTGSFTANLERWPLFDMHAQLAAESLTLTDTALKGFALEFDLEGDGSAEVWQTLNTGRLRLNVAELSGTDFALVGVEGQVQLSAEGKDNYRLGGASAFKVAAFENADISLQQAYIPLNGNLSLTDENQLQLHLNGEDRWRVADLKSTGLSIGEATLRPAFTLQLTAAGGHITWTPALHVNLEQLSFGDLRIPSLALHPSATAQLRIDRAEILKWTLKNSPWRIQLPLIENTQMQIRPEEFDLSLTQLTGKGRTISVGGKAQTERIAITAASKSAYLRDVALNVDLTPEEIVGEGDFRIGPLKQPLMVSMQHDPESGRGTFKLTTPSPLVLNQQLTLNHVLEPWGFPFNAIAGRIDLTLSADWAPGKESSAVGEIRLEDIDGQWQETTFSGLSLNHRLKLWPVIESLDQASLAIDLITSGMPITETRATLQLRQAGQTLDAPLIVELQEGHFTLFDSVFHLTPFTYRGDAAKNRIRIDTAKLDLAQLTPLFKNKGLQMSGLVAAALPLELGTDGVEMVDGTIRQKGPGVIIYHPQNREMLKRAGMPEIAIKALENFHYDNLEADVAYQPDGQLDLALRVRGKSPTAGTERPIHLNLNIEQNLLSLLESLRYSDIFDRKIEEYIKKKK